MNGRIDRSGLDRRLELRRTVEDYTLGVLIALYLGRRASMTPYRRETDDGRRD